MELKRYPIKTLGYGYKNKAIPEVVIGNLYLKKLCTIFTSYLIKRQQPFILV